MDVVTINSFQDILALPDNVVHEIVCWLTVKDFLQLDLAICDNALRKEWLNLLSTNAVSLPGKTFVLERVPQHRREKQDRIFRYLQVRSIGFESITIGDLSANTLELMHTSLTPGLASRTKSLEVNVKIRSGQEQPLYERLSLLSEFVNIQSLALYGIFPMDDSEDDRFFQRIRELFTSLRSLKLCIRNFCMTDRNPKLSETIIGNMRNLKSLSLNIMHWDSNIFQTLFVRTSNAFPSLESLYIGPIEYPYFISGIVVADDMATKCRKFIEFCDSLTLVGDADRSHRSYQLPMPNLRALSGDFLAVYPLLRIYAPQLLSIGLEEECDLCTMLHVGSLRNAMLKDLRTYWRDHQHQVPVHLHSFSLFSNRKCHPDAAKVYLRSFLRKSIGSLRHLHLEGLAYDVRVMIEWLKSPEDLEEVDLSESDDPLGRNTASVCDYGCFAQLRTFIWHPMDLTEVSTSFSAQHNSAAVTNPFGLSNLFQILGLNAPLLEEVSFLPRSRAILPLAAIGTSDMMQLRRLSLRHTHTIYNAPRQEFVVYRAFVHLQCVVFEDIGTYISEHSLLQVLPFWPQLEEFRLVQRSQEQTFQTGRDSERAVQAAVNGSRSINEYFRRYIGVEYPDHHLWGSPTAAASTSVSDRSAAPKTTTSKTSTSRAKSDTKPGAKAASKSSSKQEHKSSVSSAEVSSTSVDSIAGSKLKDTSPRKFDSTEESTYFTDETLMSMMTFNRRLRAIHLGLRFHPKATSASAVCRCAQNLPSLVSLYLVIVDPERVRSLREALKVQFKSSMSTSNKKVQIDIDCVDPSY